MRFIRKSRRSGRKRLPTNRKAYKMVRFTGVGLPDSLSVELVYCERISRAPVMTTDEYVFTGNGLYDVNITGTGGQPVYFDQLCSLYYRYRVLSSNINVEFINLQTSSGTYVCIVPSILAAGYSLLTDAVSQRYARHAFMGIKDGMGRTVIKNWCNTAKMYGVRMSAVLSEELFSAEIIANPTNLWYWIINAYSAQNPDNLAYDMLVTIKYRVRWSERVQADISLVEKRTKQHHLNLQKKLDMLNDESKSESLL